MRLICGGAGTESEADPPDELAGEAVLRGTVAGMVLTL